MIPDNMTIDPSLQPQAEAFLKKTHQDIERMEINEIQNVINVFQLRLIELTMQNKALALTQSEMEISNRKYRNFFEFAPMGYLILDEEETIKKANPMAATFLGHAIDALKGQKFSKFIDMESQDAYYLHYRNVFRTDSIQNCELRLANGDSLCVQVSSRAINAPDPMSLTMFSPVIAGTRA